MNTWLFIQLAVYELLDIIPFAVLAAAPFSACIRSKKKVVFLLALLYGMGIVRRSITLAVPYLTALLTVLWIVLYLLAFYHVIRRPVYKLLFVLITVLNYASLVAILYSYVGSCFFPDEIRRYHYCIETSISIIIILLVTYPFAFYWTSRIMAPLIVRQENDYIWARLWIVPTTFCVFFYYSVYVSGDILTFSSRPQNLLFSLVISAGSFFVLSLVLRLVDTSDLVLRLQQDKNQLKLRDLQYRQLSERMTEARRARHDMRQYVNVLQVFLDDGDTKKLRRYVEKICMPLTRIEPVTYCLYTPLNALLCYYSELAARCHAEYDIGVEYPEETRIKDEDLIVLFGNLLENAAEACGRQKSGDRFIRLRVRIVGGNLVIVLDNSCDGDGRQKEDNFNSSKRPGYGIGISSVRQIAEKYQGTARFQHGNAVFYASVVLHYGDMI